MWGKNVESNSGTCKNKTTLLTVAEALEFSRLFEAVYPGIQGFQILRMWEGAAQRRHAIRRGHTETAEI